MRTTPYPIQRAARGRIALTSPLFALGAAALGSAGVWALVLKAVF